ncbi:hypothetical protein [Cupriavidus necator]|uniref:hypothetical protein n=1 Tax=Cupriavidus necator TaxID=106590 RepID=UPI001305450B|nr:hypothetical protein [Cupriavidus necator]MDX6007322.1 hypothetical protein [Cupriavidus necator]
MKDLLAPAKNRRIGCLARDMLYRSATTSSTHVPDSNCKAQKAYLAQAERRAIR